MTVLGVDVSSYQGSPTWPAVAAAGYQFALIKFTEGATYVNPDAAQNWTAAQAAGLAVGAYHFTHPELNTPQTELAWILAKWPTLPPGTLVAVDFEAGLGNILTWAQTFLGLLAAQFGCKPFIYSYPNFLQTRGLLDASLTQYPLWYGYPATLEPAPPAPFTSISIWQSGTGTVAGVSGPVDLDVFPGTFAELQATGVPAPAPPPPVKPTPTNNDLVYFAKFLFSPSGPDLKGLSAALQPFV